MRKYKLQNWSVCVGLDDPYIPPQLAGICLSGDPVPLSPEAQATMTGVRAEKGVNGRVITTNSGSVYILGRISPKYRAWLKEQSLAYDPRNPIKLVG